jgi:AraC-like DNA-binding protein
MDVSTVTVRTHLSSEMETHVSHYFASHRHEQAKRLLLTTERSASEIGVASGHGTPRNFFRAFRQREGISPAAWRRKMRSPAAMECDPGDR